MKREGLICVGVVAALAAVGVPASAGSEGVASPRVVVACANGQLTEVEFESTPSRCVFLQRGESAAFAAAPTSSMKWSHWGRPRARGKGTGFVSMLGSTPIEVRLSEPVNKCGHRVYSKIAVKYPELGEGGDFKLDTCPR